MSSFTREKQLAFGSIVGALLTAAQRDHDLSDADVAALVLAIAAGQAAVAKWDLQTFVNQAAKCYEQGPGRVRSSAPLPRQLV